MISPILTIFTQHLLHDAFVALSSPSTYTLFPSSVRARGGVLISFLLVLWLLRWSRIRSYTAISPQERLKLVCHISNYACSSSPASLLVEDSLVSNSQTMRALSIWNHHVWGTWGLKMVCSGDSGNAPKMQHFANPNWMEDFLLEIVLIQLLKSLAFKRKRV